MGTRQSSVPSGVGFRGSVDRVVRSCSFENCPPEHVWHCTLVDFASGLSWPLIAQNMGFSCPHV